MQVNFNKPQLAVSSQRAQVRNEASDGTVAAQQDGFSLSERVQQSPVAWTIAGAVPGIGAVTNFIGMFGAGINDKDGLSYAGLGGAVANLAGTASLAGGLLTGNSTATNVGLSLLAGSAVTAGVVSYSLLRK
jgi:hypothetical protein